MPFGLLPLGMGGAGTGLDSLGTGGGGACLAGAIVDCMSAGENYTRS